MRRWRVSDLDQEADAQVFDKPRRQRKDMRDPLKVDRLPPHAIEAEQGVLGCILSSPAECIAECIESGLHLDDLFGLHCFPRALTS